MAIDEKTREALDISGLTFPRSLPVERLEAEDYTDSTGEPALKVLVVLGESAEVDSISGEDVGNLKSAIRERLRRHGINVFPYVFLAKSSELQDSLDGD